MAAQLLLRCCYYRGLKDNELAGQLFFLSRMILPLAGWDK